MPDILHPAPEEAPSVPELPEPAWWAEEHGTGKYGRRGIYRHQQSAMQISRQSEFFGLYTADQMRSLALELAEARRERDELRALVETHVATMERDLVGLSSRLTEADLLTEHLKDEWERNRDEIHRLRVERDELRERVDALNNECENWAALVNARRIAERDALRSELEGLRESSDVLLADGIRLRRLLAHFSWDGDLEGPGGWWCCDFAGRVENYGSARDAIDAASTPTAAAGDDQHE